MNRDYYVQFSENFRRNKSQLMFNKNFTENKITINYLKNTARDNLQDHGCIINIIKS